MSDAWAGTTAFDEAKGVIERLGKQLAQQPGRQQFTLLRFSQASRNQGGTQADLAGETVDAGEFAKKLDDTLSHLRVSQLAVGPAEALKAAVQMVGDGSEQKHFVYVVSDFREKDWKSAAELQKLLQKLNDAGASLEFINCVDEARPNLAITALSRARHARRRRAAADGSHRAQLWPRGGRERVRAVRGARQAAASHRDRKARAGGERDAAVRGSRAKPSVN